MQQNLYVDYFDGSRDSKSNEIRMFKVLGRFSECLTVLRPRESQFDQHMFYKILQDMYKKPEELIGLPMGGTPEQTYVGLTDVINSDQSMRILLRNLKKYTTEDHKNYIVSKSLAQALSKTKMDIKPQYLPKTMNAYIEIKGLSDYEGDEVKCLLVNIEQEELFIFVLTYSETRKAFGTGYLSFSLDPNKTLKDIIESSKHITLEFNPKSKEISREVGSLAYCDFYHTVMNSLVYIGNSSETFKEIKNSFDAKKSKRDKQVTLYTAKPFILVGSDFVLPRTFHVDSCLVSGHFRWQHYGAANSLIKLIYIDPTLRHFDRVVVY